MRLIDADALPRHGKRGGLVHWKDIENAPTIEAKQADDLISRQDAIETIRNTLADEMLSSTLELRINDLPSAQPERKTGHWILVNDSNGQHSVCEFCGEWKYHQKQKFCGECGCKMEVEHEV